ncbi:MAG: hypothetical protein Q9210_003960 [Variospora velana]
MTTRVNMVPMARGQHKRFHSETELEQRKRFCKPPTEQESDAGFHEAAEVVGTPKILPWIDKHREPKGPDTSGYCKDDGDETNVKLYHPAIDKAQKITESVAEGKPAIVTGRTEVDETPGGDAAMDELIEKMRIELNIKKQTNEGEGDRVAKKTRCVRRRKQE